MHLMQIEVNKNKYHYFFLGMQKYSFKKNHLAEITINY